MSLCIFSAIKSEDILQMSIAMSQDGWENARTPDGFSPLHHCILQGSIESLRHILDSGIHADVEDRNDRLTPLMYALEMGDKEKANMLIEHGANINYHGVDTPLNCACRNNWRSMIYFSLEKGADINQVDILGETALIKAVKRDNVRIVEWLLEKGANPNIKNKDGYTALHLAIINQLGQVTMTLLKHGADIKIKDPKGLTPLRLAKKHTYDAHYLENLQLYLV